MLLYSVLAQFTFIHFRRFRHFFLSHARTLSLYLLAVLLLLLDQLS
jgi:hypothetical protein